MSRIGNKINAGYVATPVVEVQNLRKILSFEKVDGNGKVGAALDTCAGEGTALKTIAGDNLVTYGVEIDLKRGAEMEKQIDHAIVAPIESCMISNNAFSVIKLNPPYDYSIKDIDDNAERKEAQELERALRYLMPGGVLFYTIPYYRLGNKSIARMLATNFSRISIARFTEDNFDDYKQVTVIAQKKRSTYLEFNSKINDSFIRLAESEELVMSLLTTAEMADLIERGERKPFEVPAGPTKIKLFETRLFKKSALGEVFRESDSLDSFISRNRPKVVNLDGKVPPLPLGSGQIALLLASGGINGLMGVTEVDGEIVVDEKSLHLLRGQESVRIIETVEDTEYTTITKRRQKREVAIKAILPTGEIKKFM